MVYGAIIDQGEQYYTYLDKVFHAIKNEQMNYNWLITDCVCYPQDKKIDTMLSKEYCWLSGEELTNIVEKESFQWIWAVLSGFKKGILLEDVLKHPLPYADGYSDFWKNPISIQHPLSSLEIVPWDSSLTLIFSENKTIIDNFMKGFPLSMDMTQYNEE